MPFGQLPLCNEKGFRETFSFLHIAGLSHSKALILSGHRLYKYNSGHSIKCLLNGLALTKDEMLLESPVLNKICFIKNSRRR